MSSKVYWMLKDRQGEFRLYTLAEGPGGAWARQAVAGYFEESKRVVPFVDGDEATGMVAVPVRVEELDLPNPDPEDQTSLTRQGGPAPTS